MILSLEKFHKYVLILILLNILLFVTGYFLTLLQHIHILLSEIFILSPLFSIISVITLIIFFRGQSRDAASQTLHSLVSISLKFMFEMVLALIWFYVAKKTSLTSVFIFFVIYLALSLFSIFVILKTLKNRPL